MIKRFVSLTRSHENVNHPLLGLNLMFLEVFGCIISKKTEVQIFFVIAHTASMLFVISLFVDLFVTEQPFSDLLFNLSVAAVSAVSITKTTNFIIWQKRWLLLFENISNEEKREAKKLEQVSLKITKEYTNYSRLVTYLYCILVFLTCLAMISSPVLKYFTLPEFKSGDKPFPMIMCSWFPFDQKKQPGIVIAFVIHAFMCLLGGGVIAAFDSNAVTIMTFLKGQTLILHEKCKLIFGLDEEISKQEIWNRIQECHRHHEFLLQQSNLFDSLLSPVMFIYVLVCSMSICCSVVQLSMDEVNASQKFWVLEYTVALAVQLFIYCWHGNQITDLSYKSDRAIFESNWWRADARTLKQLILLDGKLFQPFIVNAGPFNTLSLASFISIMKGAYSFYTLFSQMQEN